MWSNTALAVVAIGGGNEKMVNLFHPLSFSPFHLPFQHIKILEFFEVVIWFLFFKKKSHLSFKCAERIFKTDRGLFLFPPHTTYEKNRLTARASPFWQWLTK